MPIAEVIYYQAVCDACGFNITEEGGGDFAAWADSGTPFEEAADAGLGIGGDEPFVLCADCASTYRKGLSREEYGALADGDEIAEGAVRVWAKSKRSADNRTEDTDGEQ